MNDVNPTPQGEAHLRTLPQWAQVYVRRLLLRIETLTKELGDLKATVAYRAEDQSRMRVRLDALERFASAFREIAEERDLY